MTQNNETTREFLFVLQELSWKYSVPIEWDSFNLVDYLDRLSEKLENPKRKQIEEIRSRFGL